MKTVEWHLNQYSQIGGIIEEQLQDIASPGYFVPDIWRRDDRDHRSYEEAIYKYENDFDRHEENVIGWLKCQQIIAMCTENQQKVLRLIAEDYRVVDIGEMLGRDPQNIHQTLRRVRKRLISKGIQRGDLK